MQNLSNNNIIHVIKDDVEYIQFKKLLEYKDIIQHCFTLRLNKKNDKEFDFAVNIQNRNNSIQNYKTICNYLDLNYNNVIRPIQTHTNNVVALEEKFTDKIDIYPKELQDVDGLITNKKDIILATGYADCTPLLFFDPIKNVIANSHSGWQGTVKKIGTKTLEKMINEYGSNPKDIIVCIAPTIRECHFEVEADVKEKFEEAFGVDANIVKKAQIPKKYYINTVNANKKALLQIGIKQENIIDSNICTVCNKDKFFSYRGNNKEEGRMTLVISLK